MQDVGTHLAWMIAGATIATGCAVDPAHEGLREAIEQPIAPYESHEECLLLAAGDRLDWSFRADAPLRFDIRYAESNATLLPLTREEVESDAGIFRAILPRRYCANWEAGRRGAHLTYRLRRLPPAR